MSQSLQPPWCFAPLHIWALQAGGSHQEKTPHSSQCRQNPLLSHTQAEPSQRDNFKSGWEGKLCFYQPYWVPGKICPSSLFGHLIAVCHLPAPTPCKLQISSPFCQPLVPLAGLSRAVNRWGIIYLCLCQQHIIQAGQTAAIMMHFSFTQRNQSLSSLVNKK